MASTSLSSLFIWHHCKDCLYNGIATFIFESRYKFYLCSHKPDHIWQWVVNTQVTSLLWRDLQLSGFTMPLLGNHHSNVLHYILSLNSMNSPTSCWHFSMYFQVHDDQGWHGRTRILKRAINFIIIQKLT
jgi:hypothetical protein